MINEVIWWCLLCAVAPVLFLGCQSSDGQTSSSDLIRIETGDDVAIPEPDATEELEPLGPGSGTDGPEGEDSRNKPASSSPKTKTPATAKKSTTASTAKNATTKTSKASSSTAVATTQTLPSDPGAIVEGYDASAPDSGWSKPVVGATYSDPIYGTDLRRATSAAGTRFNRNDYSRRQAENSNGSYFLTYHGASRFDVYSVSTLELVRSTTIHPNGEPQWHPTNPNLLRHVAGGNASVGDLKLYETNVQTGLTSEIADLTSRVKARLPNAAYIQDRSEGSPSKDGTRYGWLVYDINEEQIGLVSYDLGSDRVLGITTNIGSGLVDWSGFSVNGNYVVVGALDGTFVYDADLTNRRLLTTATEHSDLALDNSGNDAYVLIDYHDGSPTAGWLVSIDMRTLASTKIFEVYKNNAVTSMHISGRGFDKPGWVIVSTYNCKDTGAWTCGKVMAVEMVANGRVVNLAHTYNCGKDYWTEAHASVNRSFTRVYFNSDGGSCGIDAEVYQLDVPNFN